MKKIIALMLALVMLLCCAGCGEKEEAPAADAATTVPTEEISPTQSLESLMEEACEKSDSGKHEIEEELVSEATCTEAGLMMYTCIACMKSETREIPALGHQGSGASCEEPSVCAVCWEVAEEAWGHQDEGGVCKYCGIDMVDVKPPVTIPAEIEPEEVETTEGTAAAEE